MRRFVVIVGLVSALLVAKGAIAQPAAGAIGGTVTASTGTGLPAATVTVRNRALNLERFTQTQTNGSYVFLDLPAAGAYEVEAFLAGFAGVVHSDISLQPDQRLSLDFTLYAATAEALVVTGRVATLEHDRSTVQQMVSETLVHSLPLVGRDFLAVASLTAGFTGSPTAPSPQGQFYWTNNVLVDGASHFSKWRGAARTFYSGYGLETIREVQVLTSQFSAEFGEALATVTMAVTNSGTNTLRGSTLLFAQSGVLNDIPAFTPKKPPFSSLRFGATLGGPIIKDRTHFFTSYEGRRTRGKNIVVSPAAPAGSTAQNDEDEHVAFLKVDHKSSSRDLLTLRYNGQWFQWHNEPGGLTLPGTGIQYTNNVHTLLATDTALISSQMLNQIRFQFARYSDLRRDLNPTVFISRAGYSAEGGTLGRFGFGADPEDTWEGADTVSYRHGPHALKFGAGMKYVAAHTEALVYGNGAYFFYGTPALYPQPFQYNQAIARTDAQAAADPRSLSFVGFAQDDWSLASRVTLNAGLRYDVERVSNVRNYTASTDTNNFQPRVGGAWEVIPGSLVVRGGVGIYTQQHLLGNINKVQLEGADGVAAVVISADSALMPTFPNALPSTVSVLPPRDIQVVDPSFRNPHSFQATVGAEHPVLGTLISADLVYLKGTSLVSLIDTNAPASTSKLSTRSVAQADLTRPIQPVSNGFRKIVSLGNLGESSYRALQVKINRASGPLQAVASYTLAKAEDLANFQLPEDSRKLSAEKGRADNDIRHNLAAGVTWTVPAWRPSLGGVTVSAFGQFRSNRPYTITLGGDDFGTTQNDARPDGRNTGKGATFRNIDVALVKRFRVGGTTIEARGESFDVLSTTNYDEYVGALSSALFGRPVSAFPRRRIQLAAVVRF